MPQLFAKALDADRAGDRVTASAYYDLYRRTAEPAGITKAIPESEPTVREAFHAVVTRAAEVESLHPRNLNKSIADLTMEQYRTPRGVQLYELSCSRFGSQPLSAVRAEVNKSHAQLSGISAALDILHQWKRDIEN